MTALRDSLANRWLNWVLFIAVVGLLVATLTFLLAWQIPLGGQVQLVAGDVAPFDVISPDKITYESPLLTEAARERAAQQVADVYDSPEGRIRRQQVDRSRDILEFITIVRNDQLATPELKTDYLLAVPDLSMTIETAFNVLNLSDSEWVQVADEVPLALDRAMRDEIRDNALAAARRKVPALISTDLEEAASNVTAELVQGLIRANSMLNTEQSESLRGAARSAVAMQTETLEDGEVIVRAGDVVSAADVEAMEHIGLLQGEWNWWKLVQALLFVTIVIAFVAGAIVRLRPSTLTNAPELAIIAVTSIFWLLAAKLMIIPHDWLPYLYPLAAFSMLLVVLIDLQISIVLTVAFMFIVQYLGSHNAIFITYAGVGALLGALTLGRAERLTAFLWAGVVVAISNLVVMASYTLPVIELATPDLIQVGLVAVINGGLSASIALIAYFIMGNIFGITTSLQLTELSRPTHPLLRQLLLKSSGTYHHTILVSNLAERAAASIGADAFLTRVGAYYHDIGKTVRPYFFTENIADGSSPHDKLDPHISAQIIISHVKDGLDLAEKYHLPPRIRDFIREHHGRSLVKYFYYQALKQAENGNHVNEADFRYPGPSPRSKETAILLLADTCEAAVRAVKPATRAELTALVNRLIDERVADGELDESNLTFKELQTTKEVFLRVLEGVHHPRISYPEAEEAKGRSTVKPVGGEQRRADAEEADSNETESSRPMATPGGVEEVVEKALPNPLDISVEINS